MTDESQELAPEPKVENPVIESNVVPPAPKKSNKNLWVIAGIVIGVLCLCSILCLVLVGTGVGKVIVERAPVNAVLDAFMKDMAAKDVESAYALFSPQAQRQIPISKVKEMIEGNNYILFEGYQSLSLGNLNLSAAANTNPDAPQGTLAKVTGTILYEGDIQGRFDSILEKVNGKWMLDQINVTVPPDKIK
jgi:hypothetical protein